jgi:hypothetical protein
VVEISAEHRESGRSTGTKRVRTSRFPNVTPRRQRGQFRQSAPCGPGILDKDLEPRIRAHGLRRPAKGRRAFIPNVGHILVRTPALRHRPSATSPLDGDSRGPTARLTHT